jgi:hypothetical protein
MAKTVTITSADDGSFAVQVDQEQPQPAQDAMKACEMAEQAFGVANDDAAEMWNSEAAKRGPDGMPAPAGATPAGGAGGPSMTMGS